MRDKRVETRSYSGMVRLWMALRFDQHPSYEEWVAQVAVGRFIVAPQEIDLSQSAPLMPVGDGSTLGSLSWFTGQPKQQEREPFCTECGGPYLDLLEQYAGHWDTCRHRWHAKSTRDGKVIEDTGLARLMGYGFCLWPPKRCWCGAVVTTIGDDLGVLHKVHVRTALGSYPNISGYPQDHSAHAPGGVAIE